MARALLVIDVQESFRQRPLWNAISNPAIADDDEQQASAKVETGPGS